MKKSLFTYFLECYTKHYVNWRGRASRREFWGFCLFYIWDSFVLSSVSYLLLGSDLQEQALLGASSEDFFSMYFRFFGIPMIYGLVSLPAIFSVSVRRLHDIGRSGWWIGGGILIFAVYTLFLLVWMQFFFEDLRSLLIFNFLFSLLGGAYNITMLVFYCTKGMTGPNIYGHDPLQEVEAC